MPKGKQSLDDLDFGDAVEAPESPIPVRRAKLNSTLGKHAKRDSAEFEKAPTTRVLDEANAPERHQDFWLIPIAWVAPWAFADRDQSELTEDSLKPLMASIKSKDQEMPVDVRQVGPQKFELLAGRRRYESLKRLGRPSIRARIRYDRTDDIDALKTMAAENTGRNALTSYSLGKIARRLIGGEFPGGVVFTQKAVADLYDVSETTVSRAVSLSSMSDAVLNALGGPTNLSKDDVEFCVGGVTGNSRPRFDEATQAALDAAAVDLLEKGCSGDEVREVLRRIVADGERPPVSPKTTRNTSARQKFAVSDSTTATVWGTPGKKMSIAMVGEDATPAGLRRLADQLEQS